MTDQTYTKPGYIFFLVIPAGLSQGFVSVALPYLLTQHGFSVATASAIVAFGLFANVWRFLWGPVVDLSLSLKKWFWIGLVVSMASIMVLCATHLNPKDAFFLYAIAFFSQVAATFTLLPVNGFMAKRIEEQHKGKASGWYQAGSLAGVGIGGGVGLWLAVHYNEIISGIFICSLSFISSLVLIFIKDIHYQKEKKVIQEITDMGKDLFSLFKVPITLFTIFIIITPIGSGAASNVWSAIANDWKASADTVALVTGVLSGLVSAIGCLIGGYWADKKGVWFSYLLFGTFCAVVPMIMALMPYHPWVYVSGVLIYTLGTGMVYAGFTALLLYAIGKKNVSTKYALLSSIGNISVIYMTVVDGWAHDRYNSKIMLLVEGIAGLIAIVVSIFLLKKLKAKNLLVRPQE